MKYLSTRDKSNIVSSAQAIATGISPEGGLYLPCEIPSYSQSELSALCGLSYQDVAKKVLGDFLCDFTVEEIAECVENAYNEKAFSPEEVTPIARVGEDIYSLELWHGPTCAFKDMALQILPHLMIKAAKKTGTDKEIVILVATSGDTGKAALEGFKDVAGTKIIVFYPNGGVSQVQYLQMATQEGANVAVYGVEGNFDDTQTTVKEIFTNAEVKNMLEENGMQFSSANSINWGRLLPQIVYYINAYCQLVANDEISMGDSINITVPTGNFGNILAAYYAKQMGLPVNKLICASNINNVLTEFINTGVYNSERPFTLTSSPSMDIVISSNLERLLYMLYQDDAEISNLMHSLKSKGSYKVTPEVLEKLQEDFYGGYCDESETAEVIRSYYNNTGYLMDTHTAVAFGVCDKYRAATGDMTKTIIASTANPYKFSGSMLAALEPTIQPDNSFEGIFKLNKLTGMEIPEQIVSLDKKEKRFTDVVKREEMKETVRKTLDI